MFREERIDVQPEAVPAPELDEDTPHYLNPKVLAEQAAVDEMPVRVPYRGS